MTSDSSLHLIQNSNNLEFFYTFAMDFNSSSPFPEGVISFLDTDLYKLTMQCAVFKFFRDVPVTYAFTNRTPDKKLSRAAFKWLDEQIQSVLRKLFLQSSISG